MGSRRPPRSRLLDALPWLPAVGILGLLSVHSNDWVGAVISFLMFVALDVAVEQRDIARTQRNRLRASLIALVAKVSQDQAEEYYAHLLPADVLDEARKGGAE